MWLMAVPTPPFPEQPPRPHARVWLRRALIAIGALTLFVGSAVGVGALWAFTILPRSLPSVTALETLQPVQGSRIYDDNDEPMTELHVERRIFVPLAQIPPALRDAIIATENSRFESDFGLDVVSLARTALSKVTGGSDLGAATLEMQLAKNLYAPGTDIGARLRQVVLAFKLDVRYSKNDILRMYLGSAYYGHGYYGLPSASQGYFGLPPERLSWAQASLLAGLVQAPSAYDPYHRLDLAKVRQRHVLDRLVATKDLTPDQARAAAAAPLHLQ